MIGGPAGVKRANGMNANDMVNMEQHSLNLKYTSKFQSLQGNVFALCYPHSCPSYHSYSSSRLERPSSLSETAVL